MILIHWHGTLPFFLTIFSESSSMENILTCQSDMFSSIGPNNKFLKNAREKCQIISPILWEEQFIVGFYGFPWKEQIKEPQLLTFLNLFCKSENYFEVETLVLSIRETWSENDFACKWFSTFITTILYFHPQNPPSRSMGIRSSVLTFQQVV